MIVAPTACGDVVGTRHRGALRYAGIPYAAPPVGDRRFAPPHPVEPWTGIRPATDPGPISLQGETPFQDALGAPRRTRSESCLDLTVFTPAADGGRRPVMVWIHGGGFVTGAGVAPIWDGSRLAAHGDVVVVAIDYRLGALGFLHLGDLDPELPSSGLNGILDQIAALEWVQENIAAFGGDPTNVTLFGTSAGAMSIGALLVMPAVRGLFRRAILQSGAGQGAIRAREARRRTARFCELAGCTTVDELRALDPSRIVDAQEALGREELAPPRGAGSGTDWRRGFQPVVEGRHLRALPIERARSGALARVDLLLGTTDHEWRLFSMTAGGPDSDVAVAGRFAAELADPDAAMRTYRARLGPDASSRAVFEAMMTDARFRAPMHHLADASAAAGNPTWLYRFAYRSPVGDGALGSCHGLDVPFVFDNRDGSVTRFVGDDSPDALADAMQRCWVAFARHGDPNHGGIPAWAPQQHDHRPVIRFDRRITMTENPEAEELAVWSTSDVALDSRP